MPATSWRLNTYSKSQHHSLQGSSTLWRVSEFPSFLRLSNISLYVYTTLCLFIPEIFLWIHLFSSYICIWASYVGKMSEVIYFPLELIPAYWLIQNLFIWGINKVNVDFLLMSFSLCSVHCWVCFMPGEGCAVVFPFPSSYQNRIPQGQPSSRTDTRESGAVISVAWQLCAHHLCSPPPSSTGH